MDKVMFCAVPRTRMKRGDKDEAVVACAADQAAFVGFKAP